MTVFLQNCQTACKASVVVVAAIHSHLSVDPHVLNLASLLVDHVVVVRSSSRDTSGEHISSSVLVHVSVNALSTEGADSALVVAHFCTFLCRISLAIS